MSKPASVLVLSSRAEDGAEIAQILGRDYSVRHASILDGMQSAIRRSLPDLVFLEWATEGLEGETSCAELAVHPAMSGVPFFVLGEPESQEQQARVLRGGAEGFLARPFCPELLQHITRKLLRFTQQLEQLQQEHGRIHETKEAIVDLIATAPEAISLQLQFEAIVRKLHTISWMETTGQGEIYLADDTGDLTLAIAYGMDQAHQQHCMQFTAKGCACGEVLKTRSPTYVSNTKTLRCPASRDRARGVHILPLIRMGKALGVFCLFVSADHKPQAEEKEFVEELACIVSALVSRRMIESVLEVKNYEIQTAQSDVIRLLGLAGEYRDTDTGLHALRVGIFSYCIAKEAGLPADEADLLLHAAPMHDIGKIGIPDSILRKDGRLTAEEFKAMQEHTLIGEQILSGNHSLIKASHIIAGSHHERWDGTGYPRGLKGEQIPIEGRICALADVFDALGQKRPYKAAWQFEDILQYIRTKSGTQFDPQLVDAFFRTLPEVVRFQHLYGDVTTMLHRPVHLPPIDRREDAFLRWDDTCSVGIPILDEHHRYLFDLTNMLCEALHKGGSVVDIAKTLKALEAYARVHFYAEEQLFEQFGYERSKAHTQEHSNFIHQIERSWDLLRKTPLISGLKILQFLSDWLIRHVRYSDAVACKAILSKIDPLHQTQLEGH